MGYYSQVRGQGKIIVEAPEALKDLKAFLGNYYNYLCLEWDDEPLPGEEITFSLEDVEAGKFYELKATLQSMVNYPGLRVTSLEVYRFGEERQDVECYYLEDATVKSVVAKQSFTFGGQPASAYFESLQ